MEKFGWDVVEGGYFVKEWEFGVWWIEREGWPGELQRGDDDVK